MRNHWKEIAYIGGGAAALALAFLLGMMAGRAGTGGGAESSSLAGPEVNAEPLAFYAGTTVNDVAVGGMTLEQSVEAMNAAAQELGGFTVVFADETVTLDGADLGWRVADYQPLQALLVEQSQVAVENVSGAQLHLSADGQALYECSRQSVLSAVSGLDSLTSYGDVEVEAPYLQYNYNIGGFMLLGGESVSGTVDPDQLTDAILAAVSAGEKTLDVVAAELYSGNNLLAEGETAQAALALANAKRNLSLTYTFGLSDGSHTGSVTISRSRMRDWLQVGEDGLSLTVDEAAVLDYCKSLADDFSDTSPQEDAQFVTTAGNLIPVNAAVNDRQVNAEALCADILSCIENVVEGERFAPYQTTSAGIAGTTDLGGTYVEVDMDNQHLYLYVDGELIAEDDICTGDVAAGCETPEGLYTFNAKQTDRTLRGPGYAEEVSYWLPFYGNYGIHDASWRTYPEDFGGDVYLENGSHGCVNMPLSLAETVFENVEVGTYIILYGGQRQE